MHCVIKLRTLEGINWIGGERRCAGIAKVCLKRDRRFEILTGENSADPLHGQSPILSLFKFIHNYDL